MQVVAEKQHHYTHRLVWTGNTGVGTSDHRSYQRAHTIEIAGKPPILGSSDPSFRGDRTRHNPEDLFVASISACHMLWYLGLCASSGLVVDAYEDDAQGLMMELADGAGLFTKVELKPRVAVAAGSDLLLAERLHHDAHAKCFIANSVNFPIAVTPTTVFSS